MKKLLLVAALAGMIGCSSSVDPSPVTSIPVPIIPAVINTNAPRFKVGDRVMTPDGPGTITHAQVHHAFGVTLDAKDEEGNPRKAHWEELPESPFDGVQKLEK